jgi:hypothetical protein
MQTRTLLSIALAGLWLAAPPALSADTDQDKFEKKLGRFAQQSPDIDLLKPRGLCHCTLDDVELGGRAGVLTSIIINSSVSGRALLVRCSIPYFDDAGTMMGSMDCERWTLISR